MIERVKKLGNPPCVHGVLTARMARRNTTAVVVVRLSLRCMLEEYDNQDEEMSVQEPLA